MSAIYFTRAKQLLNYFRAACSLHCTTGISGNPNEIVYVHVQCMLLVHLHAPVCGEIIKKKDLQIWNSFLYMYKFSMYRVYGIEISISFTCHVV